MEKREYFCIVKHLKSIFSKIVIVFIFISLSTSLSFAQTANDSIKISLLTCSPHDEVYSVYGHTAIRYVNLNNGEDWTFNYGIFNFNKPFFTLRFIFGFTDYQLGVIPFEFFKQEYSKENRQVIEQELNLTSEEKYNIYKALRDNYLPQNRVYRYNFIYNNCTTKARDIIETNIKGKIIYPEEEDDVSIRDLIHECTKDYPWLKFGDDLCLGLVADFDADRKTQQFLPLYLMRDYSKASIEHNGNKRPLVKKESIIIKSNPHITEKTYITPLACCLVLLIITSIITFRECKLNKTYNYYDAALLLVCGISGILLLALMCSLHPTTSINLQFLILNPIHLFYIWKVAKKKETHYWKLSTALIIAFFIGSIWQKYADGMLFVALSLLLRNYSHYKVHKCS